MSVTTVILDMYGVIMKLPDGGFYDFVNRYFPALTHQEMFPAVSKASIGELPSLEIFKSYGFKGDIAQIERTYLETVEINDEFFEFADKIDKNYRLAILSNDPSEWSAFVREKFDLNRYFDVITISGDVGCKKPDPEIFLHTLKKLGEKAENCLFVDDRPTNVLAAENLDMNAVVFGRRFPDYTGEHVKSFPELYEHLKTL